MSRKKRDSFAGNNAQTKCPNCNEITTYTYCHNCGAKVDNSKSFRGESLLRIFGSTLIACNVVAVDVEVPDCVQEIEEYAFGRCRLQEITIPNSVISIGNCAFLHCEHLKKIFIPASVQSIGVSVFSECNLDSIVVDEQNPNYFSSNNCLIEKATGTLIAGTKNSVIPGDGSVTCIGASAFAGCEKLQSIVIPDSVTEIGEGAFCGCVNLANVTIPNGVKVIGNIAFSKCKSFTKISIPQSVTTLGDAVFSSCENLQSVDIPSGVKQIGRWLFSDCLKLKDVNYAGAKEGWEQIQKAEDWNHNFTNCTIHCADGDIQI